MWLWLVHCLPAALTAVRAEDLDRLNLADGTELVGRSVGFLKDGLKWRDITGDEKSVPFSSIKSIEYGVVSPQSLRSGSSDLAQDSATVSANLIESQAASSPAVGASGPELPDPSTVKIGSPSEEAGEETINSGDLEAALIEPEPDDANWISNEALVSAYDRLATVSESVYITVAETSKEFEVGARWLQGNSDDLYINLLAKFERKTENQLSQMDAGGQYGKSAGSLAANRWYVNMTNDFSRDGPWIIFAASRNEYDELEHLDYRGTLSGGLGYRFINEKDKRVVTRLGPAVTREIYQHSQPDRTTPDLYGELQIRWPTFQEGIFDHKTNVHPSIQDWGIVRIVSTSDLAFPLGADGRWKLKLGLRYEFAGAPTAGRQHSDYTSNISLVYKRK